MNHAVDPDYQRTNRERKKQAAKRFAVCGCDYKFLGQTGKCPRCSARLRPDKLKHY